MIDNDLFSRPNYQLTSPHPDFNMASTLNSLRNAFLSLSRLVTAVRKCGRKHSHPFAVEFSTDPQGLYHRITLMRL
jgi:hypothetical protein